MEFSGKLIADLHCHTLASSHAYSTVTELAAAAAQQGLIAVACTDHGIGAQDAPHIWHFTNMDILPPFIHGVRVFRGVEANVLSGDGSLDMPDQVLEKMEIVVASMHAGVMPSSSMEECTRAWLAVAGNPHVDIIGHSGTPAFMYDLTRVLPAFARNGKAVEINESTFHVRASSVPVCRQIAEACKRYRVPVVLNSDAHYHAAVGLAPLGTAMPRDIDFPPELIVNGSRGALHAFLNQRGVRLSINDSNENRGG